MHKGHINIDFVTEEMLSITQFHTHNHVRWCGGFWKEQGVPVPDFPYEAPWVHQSFDQDCPYWAHKIKSMFDDVLEHSTVTINLMKPGRYIPPHKDLFFKLLQNAPEHIVKSNLEPVRINVFLQDHHIGHIYEMNGETWLDYKKGDYTVIKKGIPHCVINIGYMPRYTLQVSGFAKPETFT